METVSETVSATKSVGKEETDAVLAALQRAGGAVDSNDELAALMGCSKGESSKRVAAMNGAVHKVRIGREVRISLPEQRIH